LKFEISLFGEEFFTIKKKRPQANIATQNPGCGWMDGWMRG